MNAPRLLMGKVDAAGASALTAMTVLAYVLVAGPALDVQQARAGLDASIAQQRQLDAELRSIQTDLNDRMMALREALASSRLRLRDATRLNSALGEITRLAETRGLTVMGTQTDSIEKGSDYARIPIRLRGMGRSGDVARLLHDLRIECKDMGVRALSLVGGTNSGGRVGFEVEVLWFVTPVSENEG